VAALQAIPSRMSRTILVTVIHKYLQSDATGMLLDDFLVPNVAHMPVRGG